MVLKAVPFQKFLFLLPTLNFIVTVISRTTLVVSDSVSLGRFPSRSTIRFSVCVFLLRIQGVTLWLALLRSFNRLRILPRTQKGDSKCNSTETFATLTNKTCREILWCPTSKIFCDTKKMKSICFWGTAATFDVCPWHLKKEKKAKIHNGNLSAQKTTAKKHWKTLFAEKTWTS